MLKYSANITYRLEKDFEADLCFPELKTEVVCVGHPFTGNKEDDVFAVQEAIRHELNRHIEDRVFIESNTETTGEFILKVDKDTEMRIRLSNWFIEQTTYESFAEIDSAYGKLSGSVPRNEDCLNLVDVLCVFDLNERFDLDNCLELARVFKIPADYLEPMDDWTKEIMTHPAEC